jgi:hypothetical protein
MMRYWAFLAILSLGLAADTLFEMTVRDGSISRLSNLNIAGSVVGRFNNLYGRMEYNYNGMRHAPRRVSLGGIYPMGTADVHLDVGYDLVNQTGAAQILFDAGDTVIGAKADTRQKLTYLDISQRFLLGGKHWQVVPGYDFATKSFNFKTQVNLDPGRTDAEFEYDGSTQNAWVRLRHQLDKYNAIAPQVSLRDGTAKYSWVRRLGLSACLETIFEPGKQLELRWTDPGYAGSWITTAVVPLADPAKSCVSFRRVWEL